MDGVFKKVLNLGKSPDEVAAVDQYEALLERIVAGHEPLDGLADRVRGLQTAAGLGTLRTTQMNERAFARAAENAVADRRLTGSEEQALLAIARALGIEPQTVPHRFPHVYTEIQICAVNDGRLPVATSPRLIAQPGETVHAEYPAGVLDEVTARTYVERSNTFRWDLFGVPWYTGKSTGEWVTESEVAVVDRGTLAITSQRVTYLGADRSIDLPFATIAALDVLPNGLRITGRGLAPTTFQLQLSGDLAAAVLHRAVANHREG